MATPRATPKYPKKPKRGKPLEVEAHGVIYARYSSHNQKDASIEQQVDWCRDLAAEFGITVIDIYADRHITGRTDKRKDFQRMLRELPHRGAQYVISWKSNRIGRNMLEALINEARLQDMGVRVLYVEEDFDDTAAGRFAARSMMNVNQFYSENMAEDVKRGMLDNAKKCLANGQLPFGYKKAEGGGIVLDEDKASIVKEIFTRVAAGEYQVDIINDLNARGIRSALGRDWKTNSFQRMLSNERYMGIYLYDDVRIEGGIPRIISDELFYQVQEVLHVKKNARGRHRVYGDYLLTGKLFCGLCKSPMTGISGTSKTGDRHYYYVCQKKRVERACRKENVRRDVIEAQVAQAIRDYALRDDVIEWIADSTVAYNERQESLSGLSLLYDQLSDVEKSVKNLLSAIEAGIITDTTRQRMLDLEAQQRRLKAQIATEKASIITVPREDIIAGLTMFRDGDIEDSRYRAQLFDTFLVAVYLYDDDLKIVFSFSGDKNTVTLPLEKAAAAVDSPLDSISPSGVRLIPPPGHQKSTNFDRGLSIFFCSCSPRENMLYLRGSRSCEPSNVSKGEMWYSCCVFPCLTP